MTKIAVAVLKLSHLYQVKSSIAEGEDEKQAVEHLVKLMGELE